MNHRKARGGIIEGLEKLESIYCYILESIFLKCLVKYWWQYRCQKTFDFQEVIHLATYPFWIWIDFHVIMKYLCRYIIILKRLIIAFVMVSRRMVNKLNMMRNNVQYNIYFRCFMRIENVVYDIFWP